jgi:hypothetical protein
MVVTTTGDVYEVYWDIADVVEIGSGIQVGEHLAVGYPNDACSTAIYVPIGESLVGLWVGPNSTTLNTEAATWLNPDDESGVLSFTLEGTNPDGSTYTGGMALTRLGDLFTVSQSVGDETTTGTGIYDDAGIFAVTYGLEEGCGVMLYTVGGDGSMSGVWGIFGYFDNLMGSETAIK